VTGCFPVPLEAHTGVCSITVVEFPPIHIAPPLDAEATGEGLSEAPMETAIDGLEIMEDISEANPNRMTVDVSSVADEGGEGPSGETGIDDLESMEDVAEAVPADASVVTEEGGEGPPGEKGVDELEIMDNDANISDEEAEEDPFQGGPGTPFLNWSDLEGEMVVCIFVFVIGWRNTSMTSTCKTHTGPSLSFETKWMMARKQEVLRTILPTFASAKIRDSLPASGGSSWWSSQQPLQNAMTLVGKNII